MGLCWMVRVEQIVEAGERGRAAHEIGDRLGLHAVDPGRDVDQRQTTDEIGGVGGERDRRHAAERHPDDEFGIGRHGADHLGHVGGHRRHSTLAGGVGRGIAVAVARQVDRDERPVERQRHRVPRVGVLGAAVDQHDLGWALAPHQRAEVAAIGQGDRLPPHRGRPVVGQADLGGVVGEVGELVVRALGRSRPARYAPRAPTESVGDPPSVGIGDSSSLLDGEYPTLSVAQRRRYGARHGGSSGCARHRDRDRHR